MKATLTIVALALCFGFSANAAQIESVSNTQELCLIQQEPDGYEVVEFETLAEPVKQAIIKMEENYSVSLIEFNAQLEITRVTFVSKLDEKDIIVVLFDKEGKVVENDNPEKV